MIGLDKITAKTSEINITLGDTKKFGFLKIKAIKCGEINSVSKNSKAAYIQVVDLTDTKNEKVFVFNGWTFSANPSFTLGSPCLRYLVIRLCKHLIKFFFT